MAQVEQIRDLPEEVWKEILLKLWLNEEDLEHLLTCRLVCRSWEKLVDEMPPKPYWNPWLKHRLDDYDTVGYSIATIIRSDTDIKNFLSSGFELEKNPFRNHTLSIFLDDVKNEENLLKIIEDHGKHVWKFLYHPAKCVAERLTNFPQLLTHMKNIRTLQLVCGYLSKKQLMAIDGKDFPKVLEKLSELVLIGDFRCNGDDRMYTKLSVNYGSQIKSLTLETLVLLSNRCRILDKFPNLEDLKVHRFAMFSAVVKLPPGKQWPKLKRLALAVCEWDPIFVKNILSFVSCFAGSLQRLSFGLGKCTEEAVCESNQNNDAVVIPTFPNLTQLIIPFWFMHYQGQPTNLPLETSFRFSLPNIKSLVLEDTYDEFKDRDIGGAELEEICGPLWPLVPSSVETISVRSGKTNQVLHQDFPVVYKCKRNEAS